LRNLDNLKKQAKQLVRWHREAYYPVAQRIRLALPRYQQMDDKAILNKLFTLADAQELIARELGFENWETLRIAKEPSPAKEEQQPPHLLGAQPQVFVSDVEAACRFFVEKLGFTVVFHYGQPPFYALVERDGARINLRFVHSPVLHRKPEPDLLSASIPVKNIKSLYLELRKTAAPMHQTLKTQPWGLRDFIVLGPDQNLLHFSEAPS
jgi:catechol 2,3-dioxygenase-like lactoylglutathione lyase family enzyme